jgi:hypothetical protein
MGGDPTPGGEKVYSKQRRERERERERESEREVIDNQIDD